MKLNKGYLVLTLFVILLMAIGYGSLQNDIQSPAKYTTYTSTSVNFSIVVTAVGEGTGEIFNVSVFNRTGTSGTFGFLGSFIAINGTQKSAFLTLKDNERTFWYFSLTNVSSSGAIILETRILDVDTRFLVFSVGVYDKLNFTLDTGDISTAGSINAIGNITTSGWLEARNLSLIGADGNRYLCGVNNSGNMDCRLA